MIKNKFKETEIGKIPEDWDVKNVGEFVDIKHGYAFKGEFFTDIPNGNILLTPGNFKIGGGFKSDKLKYTKEESPIDYVLKEDDVVVTMTDLSKEGDTLGYSAKVPASKGEKYLHNQRIGLLKFKSKEISPDFMYWILRTKKYNFFVVGSATGSTVKHTSPNRIKQFIFGIPINVNEQQSVAKILSDLDSKIELNQQMNTTLESIGQALFKHWFVDFEFPNEEGKPYKSSGGEMVDSELGEVPKGWRVGSILDCADLLSGGTPKTEIAEYWGGDIPWVSAKDVTDANGSFVLDTERKITQAGVDKSNAKLLPKNTTVVTARGTVGSYCILSREMAINQTNYGLKTKYKFGDVFIFFSISNLVNQMKQSAYGTIFDTITTKTFKEMKIVIPPEPMIMSFDDKMSSIMSKILQNLEESRTLAALRDALLPKLMSGEIRVPVGVKP